MIKAHNNEAIFLGLSDLNLSRLREGQPIAFDGSQVGVPGKRFIIMAGSTEESIADMLTKAGLITADTKMQGVNNG